MARILAGGDATDAAPGLGARPTPRRGGFAVRCFDGQSATGQPQPTGVEADSVCQCQRDRIILRPSGGALRPGPLQGPQEGRPGAGIHRPARGQGRSEVSGQGELSLTQVLDRPLSGRVFFEEVIRENLDLGSPDHVALIFGKRVTRRTPGWFRTRGLTQGVMAALHADYFGNKIKPYFKEGRAGRTETTIHHPKAFGLRKGRVQ